MTVWALVDGEWHITVYTYPDHARIVCTDETKPASHFATFPSLPDVPTAPKCEKCCTLRLEIP